MARKMLIGKNVVKCDSSNSAIILDNTLIKKGEVGQKWTPKTSVDMNMICDGANGATSINDGDDRTDSMH